MPTKLSMSSYLSKNVLSSNPILFLFCIVCLIFLWCMIIHKDNESIFLFLILGFLLYSDKRDPLFILAVPFFIVSILIYIRYLFQNTDESFINYEKYDPFEFQQWILNYIKYDETYKQFTEVIEYEDGNGFGNLSELITNMKANPMKTKTDDSKHVTKVKNHLMHISTILSTDKAIMNTDQVVYVRKMIDLYNQQCNNNDSLYKFQILLKEFVDGQMGKYDDKTFEDFKEDVKDISNNNIGNLSTHVNNVINNMYDLSTENPDKSYVKTLRDFLMKVTNKDIVPDANNNLVIYAGDMKNYIARELTIPRPRIPPILRSM